jgi:hypothetical protein
MILLKAHIGGAVSGSGFLLPLRHRVILS